jgi:hypothetical protein
MKSTADIVIENSAAKSMILSTRINSVDEFIEMFSKNPNKNTENVVKMALSLNTAP